MAELLEGLDAIGDALRLLAATPAAVAARRRRLARYIAHDAMPVRFLGGRYYADRDELVTWWRKLPARAPRRARRAIRRTLTSHDVHR